MTTPHTKLSPAVEVHIPGHGYYTVRPEWIDTTYQRLADLTTDEIRRELVEQTTVDLSDVDSRFHLIVIHADCNARFDTDRDDRDRLTNTQAERAALADPLDLPSDRLTPAAIAGPHGYHECADRDACRIHGRWTR